jgi:hypothetical protein
MERHKQLKSEDAPPRADCGNSFISAGGDRRESETGENVAKDFPAAE